ncbi:MAG: hypothetical protein RLZZ364_184, partial [Actinomycetota bacterium]
MKTGNFTSEELLDHEASCTFAQLS